MASAKGSLAYILSLILFTLAVWTILTRSGFTESSVVVRSDNQPVSASETPGSETSVQKRNLAIPAAGVFSTFRYAFAHPFPLLLCQLAVVVAVAVLFGRLSQGLGQPVVIGEMAAGILLGPSILGLIFPGVEAFLFPPDSLGNLNLLSQVGILLFMFSVGMEIDLGSVRRHAKVALFVSHAGIILPFLFGMVAALLLFRNYAPPEVKFTPFALFMGIAMSITAFPVLARIIKDRSLSGTVLGNTAMASAAVDDVTAWTLLSLVIAIARAESPLSTLYIAVLACAFTLFMLFLVRPVTAGWAAKTGDVSKPGRGLVSLVLVGIFLSALATEVIGIHSLFGAFLAGTIMPPGRAFRAFLKERLEYPTSLFLLPVFFASTGLRARVDTLDQSDWAIFAGLLTVAVAGKLGGVSLAARFTGVSWRDALALGALMNTRGLMELIVLNVGLDLGILSPRIFTMMVLVALATTAMTGPILTGLGVGLKRAKGTGIGT